MNDASGPAKAENLPPPLPTAAEPPLISPSAALPPPSEQPSAKSRAGRQFLAFLLSLCLALFVVDGLASFIDETLRLAFRIEALSILCTLLSLFTFLICLLVYALMAFTRAIPKKWFVPVILFSPVAALLSLPILIYAPHSAHKVGWLIALLQVGLGLGIFWRVQTGKLFRWPLISEPQLPALGFTWTNLLGFVLTNLLLLLPGVLVYLGFCASLAANHLSEGFVRLRPRGLSVQARTYANDVGSTVRLVPMAHIGDRDFYQKVSQSFPTNSLVLMEGVTDEHHLLTNKITYQRFAKSLGLAEQQQEFRPVQAEIVRADVDVQDFSATTIALLNVAMLIHSKGFTSETIQVLSQFSPPPGYDEQLWKDILHDRNHHLLDEIKSHQDQSRPLIVPWGAAHMPELARELQKSGFHLQESKEYQVIRFGPQRRVPARAS